MSKNVPKVAIITRTKNRTILLRRALESVRAQTSKDYVHVVLNDGGDKIAVEKLLAEYPDKNRVVIHNERSVGLTPALNQAIKAVNSEYVAILDDDDSWAPDRVEKVNEYLDKTDVPGVVVVMDRIIEKIEGSEVVELSRNRWLEGVEHVSLYKQCLDNYLSNGSFTYRRSLYDELGGYDESLGAAEDWDFGIRTLLTADVPVLVTDHALTFYHHRPEQSGDEGNSVFSSISAHADSLNRLRNKYLRQDIEAGRFGIGYIMNKMAEDRERDGQARNEALGNVVRLEGHINLKTAEVLEYTDAVVKNSLITRRIKRRFSGK